MTRNELLIQARALIADPARWCRKALARDPKGKVCPPDSPEAVSWCALGAMAKVAWEHEFPLLHEVLAKCPNYLGLPWDQVAQLNDRGGHDQVLALYDKKIKE